MNLRRRLAWIYLLLWPLLVFAVVALAATAPRPEPGQLGSVHFQNSCNGSVASLFDRGIAQLHSFEYESAQQTFESVAKQDPSCAMAQWGIAMSHYHQLWENSDLKAGAPAMQQAETLAKSAKTTAREKAYIAALGKIYASDSSAGLHERAIEYEQAMAKLHQEFPSDIETTAFYALSIDATAPNNDKTYQQQNKCGKLLEPLLEKYPRHPGVTHYLIHCYDNPLLASKALKAARSYAKIAPASAHAQHMPSHIFTRVGSWDESIRSNRAAAEVARKMEAASAGQARGERLHAMDYLEYAYLQEGDVQQAQEVLNLAKQLSQTGPEAKNSYALAAIPARFALELEKWEQAKALPVDETGSAVSQAITWLARGVGAARSGDVVAAQQAAEHLAQLRDQLKERKDDYWSDQVEIQRLEVSGWLSQAKGDPEEARSQLNNAADLEDSIEKRPVTPGPIIPAREMLAQLWMAQKHPDEAFTEYETVLRTSPNRFNAVYGAAKAAASIEPGATALLDSQESAVHYYKQLLAITRGRTQRPEVKEAGDFVDAHNKSKFSQAKQ